MGKQKNTPRQNSVSGIAHLALILVAVAAIGVVGYLMLRGGQINQPQYTTPETESADRPPTPDIKTVDWKKYEVSEVNLKFQLPPDVYNHKILNQTSGEYKVLNLIPAMEAGPTICATFENQYNKIDRFTGCHINLFGIEIISDSFIEGRTINSNFVALNGFTKTGGEYYIGRSPSKLLKINAKDFKTIKNSNGLEIIKLTGGLKKAKELNIPYTAALEQSRQWLIALVNTPDNSEYKGMVVAMEETETTTDNVFNQILSTLRFDSGL